MPARMSERHTSLIAALLVAIGPVSMALYTPAMPELVRAFDSSNAAIKSTLTFYFAGFAVAQLLAGPLSDAFGRRRAALGFLSVYLVGSVLAATAVSVEMLLVARLIQGTGAAVGVTVARAIVRDQFTGDKAARIMNMVGIMLAIAPAMSPALGGFTLALAGWQAIFYLMVGFGVVSSLLLALTMRETSVPSRAYAEPRIVIKNYRTVLGNAEFLSASIVCGFAVGALYAQATILPFVLIDTVGLTPTEFGFGMLMQSGSFFLGSVTMRLLMRRHSAERLVLPGLCFISTGAVLLIGALSIFGASFFTVMAPIAFAAFGIAFIMPHMQIGGLLPFPHIAGSASAMMGFIQMGSGLLGGTVAALIGHPVLAIAIVVPSMSAISVMGYVWHLKEKRLRTRAAAEMLAEKAAPAE
ncbi:multidrug effflux MFS transporter [Pararhizobium haloflavum]|uniref:multidrug effflux MFS transporter n=1 Tax=Pararhizobium haloflavum TaxID=2037914 RepID=UPI000C18D272|nr:multidrug effflux MFS transporter [Pararhizobium haloflavum]